MKEETITILENAIHNCEGAKEVLNHEVNERSIHAGLYFVNNAIMNIARALLKEGKETE